MGYVNDTEFCQWIPPQNIGKSAGTWTDTLASNVASQNRGAAAAAFNLMVPIEVPGNYNGLKGSRLKSVELLWKNATADLTSVTTVELEKQTFAADGTAPTGAAVTVTLDSANDTTAKRITQASHTMKVTLTTPEWVSAGSCYVLYVTFDAAATSAISLYGARANYEMRA